MLLVLVLLTAIHSPIDICFYHSIEPDNIILNVIEFLIMIIFPIDLLLNLRNAYTHENNNLITDD